MSAPRSRPFPDDCRPVCRLTAARTVALAAALACTATGTCAQAAEGGLALQWAGWITTPAHAAPGEAASTWPDLLEWASRQGASGRAADAEARAARALGDQAWSTAWMPRVDLSAAAQRSAQTINGVQVNTPTRSVEASASLPLWRPADRAGAQAQAAQADQARWQALGVRASVARELSVAYLNAVEAAEQRRLVLAQQSLLEEQLRINDRRLQAGVGTVLEVLETRTRVDQTRAVVQDLETRLATQRLALERLSGRRVAVLPAGLSGDNLEVPEVVPSFDEALALAPQRNPQWQDTLAQIAAAKATAQARDAERWQPALDAVASIGRSRQVQQFSGISDEQNVSARTWGLQLSLPLYSGGYQEARVREASARLSLAEARRDEAEAAVAGQLRDAYQRLAQSRAAVAVQHEVAQSATATFDALRKAFTAGMRTNQDLLDAQQQIYVARQSVVSARINALLAQVDILALLDLLDRPHIAPLTSLMDTAS